MEQNTQPKSKMAHQLVIVLIIAILLALTLILTKNMRMDNQEDIQQQAQQEMINADPVTMQAQTQSPSDDVSAIDADLANTNIDELDKGL
jgi:flagellar basal body-associated protein FliL